MDNLPFDDTNISEGWSELQHLRHQNRLLENKIVSLTSKNIQIGEEMNSLLHAISHDLRAPLRAIDGYSRILEQDYNTILDDEGLRFLHILRASTQNMDEMLNGIVTLSRTATKDFCVEPINMQRTVSDVIDEFSQSESLERIEIEISDLPDAYGDPGLIKLLWKNLISNAIKFSSPKENPLIAISGNFDYEKCTYKIKDNGVGFNPSNKEGLFTLFQRLHKVNEFKGSGVGLSIAQRIVHRHNGEIWGDGQQDQGAEFCFSLPIVQEPSLTIN